MNIEYFKNFNYDALKQRLIELQDFGEAQKEWREKKKKLTIKNKNHEYR